MANLGDKTKHKANLYSADCLAGYRANHDLRNNHLLTRVFYIIVLLWDYECMKKTKSTNRAYYLILSIGGALGMIAMTWQASERIAMLKNPTAPLNCNISPVIDCGTVLGNKLAALFGFPNAFIGMIVFSMLALAGIAGLSGVVYTKAFKSVVLTLSTILLLFSMWFFGASLYSIGKICIFCAVGWVVSLPIFVYSLTDWLEDKKSGNYKKFYAWLNSNKMTVLVTWYIILICLFLYRFRDYYFN